MHEAKAPHFCYGMVIGSRIKTNGCRLCFPMRKHQPPSGVHVYEVQVQYPSMKSPECCSDTARWIF